MHDIDRRHALVFAIAHELGNHLAGIRLEAHLLDESLGPRGLAKASIAIDTLAGQAGPLLALLRPLLSPSARRPGIGTLANVLDGVRRQLEEEGTAGRAVALRIAADAAAASPPFDGLHALLVALVGAPEAPAGTALGAGAGAATATIELALDRAPSGVVLRVERPDGAFVEAAEEQGEAADRLHGLRGRALALALARVLVEDAGGRVEVGGSADRSRVELSLPQ